jgi:hypothetical protein
VTEREQLAAKSKKIAEVSKMFSEGMKERRWDQAEGALNELEKIVHESARPTVTLARFKFYLAKGDSPAGYKIAESLSDSYKTNAILQNGLAWSIVADDIDDRNYVLAEKFANRANTAAQGKSAGILDTLARVQFMSGKTNEALASEQKAVDLSIGNEKTKYQTVLDSYKEGKLPKLGD